MCLNVIGEMELPGYYLWNFYSESYSETACMVFLKQLNEKNEVKKKKFYSIKWNKKIVRNSRNEIM